MLKYIVLNLFIFSSLLLGDENIDVEERLYIELKKEFKDDFDVWGVEFYKENSTIRFSKNNFLFQRGSANISRTFKIILKDFYPRYIKIVSKYEESIAEVIIKGHTSSENNKAETIDDKYYRNLILSQERANSVYSYIKGLKSTNISKIKPLGVSSSELILDKKNSEEKEKSRRIEFFIKFNSSNQNITKDIIVDDGFTKDETDTSISDNLEDINITENKKKIISLEYYVRKLLMENPTINEKNYLLRSIKQDIKIAKKAFNPTVTLNGSYKKYEDFSDDTGSNKDYDRSVDITAKYNLFNGFKDSKELKITEANYLTTLYTKDQIENDLIFSLVEAFITIQKTHEYYELSRKNYSEYIKWMDKEELRFQNGLVSLKDFAKIQARAISRFMNFEEDTKRYLDGISTMQKYIDFSDDDIEFFESLEPRSKYFDNPLKALEDSKEFSPYVKEANQNIKLYKEKMDKSKVNFYPSLDLVGKKSRLKEYLKESSSSTNETSIALEAKLELYSGGKEEADYQKKLIEYKLKIQKRDEVVRDTLYKVDLAFNTFGLTMVKNDFLKDLVSKREEEHIASNYDFKFAKIDANGLLDVVDSLYNAKRQYIENNYDMILAKYRVLSQIGIIKNKILEK
ncbi:MAG: TolC family protein [Campylobacterota bacterium]|nr:TolC family protein [Campylobacterota bacterium]